LLQVAIEGGISATERNKRLHALQLEETRLRYDEEASICAPISNGDDAADPDGRSSMNLMLRHEPAGGTRAAFSASLRTEGFVVRG